MSARQSFARVPVAVFGDRRLSVRDMRVLGALYAHADAHGLCWPSLGTIGEVAALDRRDAQRALRRLGAARWLAVDGGGGRGDPRGTADVPLTEVRDLLGHGTIRMIERYAHLAPENVRAAVARLEGQYTPPPGPKKEPASHSRHTKLTVMRGGKG